MEASRCFTFESRSIMISMQYFAKIYIAFENLTIHLIASDTKPTFVAETMLKVADLYLRHINGPGGHLDQSHTQYLIKSHHWAFQHSQHPSKHSVDFQSHAYFSGQVALSNVK